MSWRTSGHLFIGGGTGQGKSVGANEIFAEARGFGVFFAPDPEPWFVGTRVSSPDELHAAMARGATKAVYEFPMHRTEYEAEHEYVARLLMSMGEYRDVPSVLVTDEAHEIGGGSLEWVAKRGRKRNVRLVVVSQDLASIPNSILRQCNHLVWVGPASPFTVEYLANKKIADAAAWAENADHEYRVIRRDGTTVDRGFFDNARYGDGR